MSGLGIVIWTHLELTQTQKNIRNLAERHACRAQHANGTRVSRMRAVDDGEPDQAARVRKRT